MSNFRIINVEQGSEAWHEERQKGIGGSDISAIMGESPFGTAWDFWNNRVNGESKPVNKDAVDWGHAHEPDALKLFQKIKGYAVTTVGMMVANENEIFRASPDGLVELDLGEGEAILEIKCPYAQDIPETAPEYYRLQVQWNLFISGYKKGFLFYWIPNGHKIFEIEADPELHQRMAQAAIEFWDTHIEGKAEPTKDETLDMSGNDEWRDRVSEYIDATERKKATEDELKRIKKELIGLAEGKKAKGHGLSLSSSWTARKDYKGACENAGINAPEKAPTQSYTIRKCKK